MSIENSILRFFYYNWFKCFLIFLMFLLTCFSILFSLESNLLIKEYDELKTKITHHSSIAEKLTLKHTPVSHSDPKESIVNGLMIVFNEYDVNSEVLFLAQDVVFVKVETIELIRFLDVMFILCNDETIVINNVNIHFNQEQDYVSAEITILPSQGI
ncbi:Uncharacterised protein [Yersinia rohdei]|nr:Uncharacterised protein [Yersinia rohdei]